ncbi:MAG TPA: DUF5989 family protein [Thermoanaerobaculia bacterium]|nr:DUF5989 family protein [Thermoanaerobaculia bacterium]
MTKDFQQIAHETPEGNLLVEWWRFVRQNRKWWLLPIIIVVLCISLMVWLASGAAAPLIYSLF